MCRKERGRWVKKGVGEEDKEGPTRGEGAYLEIGRYFHHSRSSRENPEEKKTLV